MPLIGGNAGRRRSACCLMRVLFLSYDEAFWQEVAWLLSGVVLVRAGRALLLIYAQPAATEEAP